MARKINKIDGYIEHEHDIFDNFYKFKQEETRVLYPFIKVRCGGSDMLPQYFFSLIKQPKKRKRKPKQDISTCSTQ